MAAQKLSREQQDIKEELDQFLNDDGAKDVLERHRRLLRLAHHLLNNSSGNPGNNAPKEALVADSVSDPWGTCCTTSGCVTDTKSHCASIGGSFSQFPSG
jgi:hypothetical protein